MRKKISIFEFLFFALLFFLFVPSVFALEIEDTEQPVRNDFVVSPGKIEVWLDPGSSTVREFTITNRLGKDSSFQVEIEDFKGSRDIEKPVIFLGGEKGPYSLKDYLKPEASEFSLKHGQRVRFFFEISIPKDAEPGGRYGAVIISRQDSSGEKRGGVDVSVKERIAVLIFVRVRGPVREYGLLKDFLTSKRIYTKPSIPFKIYFENNGNVHLNPYGILKVKNLLGQTIAEIEVNPFFVLPDSLKLREILWERNFLFGYYQAELFLNRGYQDIVDQKRITFWVFPLKYLLVFFFLFLLLVIVFYWIINNFEIRRRKTQ
ncbi:MAG: hypothetical protein ACPLZH_01390 [Minisyncoccales bacterium]